MALTNDLNARYATAQAKSSKGSAAEPYVPKARKTQRARQKPRQPRTMMSSSLGYAHGSAAG